jgi:predicted MFS family arabinose efflux permease
VAGLIALATGLWDLPWRAAWLGFSAAALAVTAWNLRALPAGVQGSGSLTPTHGVSLGWLLRPGSVVLFGVASSFGVVSGFYWSFAVDLISRWGILALEAGPVFYLALGIAGFVGLLTGDAIDHFGLRYVLAACFVSLGVVGLLLGVAPASWTAVVVSAAFMGAGVMCTSALLSMWSSLLFPERPSTGFSAALLFLGIGTIVGPVALGIFAGHSNLDAAFLVAGAFALLTAPVAALARTSEDPPVEPTEAPVQER